MSVVIREGWVLSSVWHSARVDVRQHVRTTGLIGLMCEGMTREGMTRERACTSSAPLARAIARGPRLPPAFIGLS